MFFFRKFKQDYVERPFRYQAKPRLVIEINEVEIPIENISVTGVGFYKRDRVFNLEDKHECKVKFMSEFIETKVKVARLTETFVGVQVIEGLAEYENFVKELYKYEELASQVRYIGPERLKESEYGEPHWFYGEDNCEVFFTLIGDEVTYFTVVLFGNVVEYKRDSNTLFIGHISDEETNPLKHKKSDLVDREEDEEISLEHLHNAAEFVKNINFLHVLEAKYFMLQKLQRKNK